MRSNFQNNLKSQSQHFSSHIRCYEFSCSRFHLTKSKQTSTRFSSKETGGGGIHIFVVINRNTTLRFWKMHFFTILTISIMMYAPAYRNIESCLYQSCFLFKSSLQGDSLTWWRYLIHRHINYYGKYIGNYT